MKNFFALLFATIVCLTVALSSVSCFEDDRPINIYQNNSDGTGIADDTVKIFIDGGSGIIPTDDTTFEDIISATPSKEGLVLSFSCAETERAYKFIKPITLSTDLEMEIDPEWTDEDYKVTIKFSKLNF